MHAPPLPLAALAALAALGAPAAARAGEPPPEPYLLGRVLGAEARATVRGGLWVGNLTNGFYSAIARGEERILLPELDDVGRGSGIITELGVSLTAGDYDLAFSFLTDQFVGGPEGDDAGSRIARAALRQLVGELRTRALRSLVGTELRAEIRTGDFTGPVDGTRFRFRNNEPWFAGKNATWATDYLSLSLGGELSPRSPFALGEGTFMGLRYTTFSKPQAADPFTTFEISLVDTRVRGLSGYWQVVGEGEHVQASMLLGLGLAQLDYGAYGRALGFLGEMEFSGRVHHRFSPGGLLGVLVYAGFRANLVQPITATFSATAENPIYINGIVDYLLWGPTAGLEVTL
jgi:hypothetical protein